jgi:hypothetical protein
MNVNIKKDWRNEGFHQRGVTSAGEVCSHRITLCRSISYSSRTGKRHGTSSCSRTTGIPGDNGFWLAYQNIFVKEYNHGVD